ncbi:OmpA family protein [Haliangium ochraceum]|uniref:OmpA/MotB domain protein n=1 Tax=Haliangium ochraceum (strain DSM 14365 / JCM 11303 / SMP-2) TaxID=502025 RepID=D0LZ23_HALO1|nr:OmpA family protein [Haliangium ochraceum]ACY14493.1 OmpA/MotB domain protein [Haliangium ochraceum DSM 14365]
MKFSSLRSRGTKTLFLSAAAVAMTASAAHADRIDLGLFGGVHIFSNENELGVVDTPPPAAPSSASPVNSADIGLRVAYEVLPKLYVEAEADIHPTRIRRSEAGLLVLGWRASALYDLASTKQRPFLMVGVGGLTSFSDDETLLANDTDFVPHIGTGIKFDLPADFGARVDLRASFPPSSTSKGGTTDLEVLLGFYKSFGVVPPPPPPMDTDGDGIFDESDQCPNEPEDMDGNADDDGCPEEEPPADTDGDGMTDDVDQCPNEAEDVDGFSDEDGCPDLDNDGDGIPDASDQCSDSAEDPDGFADEDGCPDEDNDGDGIVDAADQCMNEPETANGYQDGDGCPDEIPEEVKNYTGSIEGIRFANNSDRILPVSRKVLDEAARILVEYPDLRVEISGHSDDRGKRDFNIDLSKRRAEAVRVYLVGKGVEDSRLVSMGFGPDRPLVENTSNANRAKNRRVEFNLIVAGGANAEAEAGVEAEAEVEAGAEDAQE